jgi:hypothetical protein
VFSFVVVCDQVRSYLSEVVLDQIPTLATMRHYLEQLSMMDPPPVKRDLILEQVNNNPKYFYLLYPLLYDLTFSRVSSIIKNDLGQLFLSTSKVNSYFLLKEMFKISFLSYVLVTLFYYHLSQKIFFLKFFYFYVFPTDISSTVVDS